jgi:hypothetical protein
MSGTLYFSFLKRDVAEAAMSDFHFLQNWKGEPGSIFNTSGICPVLIDLGGDHSQDDFLDLLNRLYEKKFNIWIDSGKEAV